MYAEGQIEFQRCQIAGLRLAIINEEQKVQIYLCKYMGRKLVFQPYSSMKCYVPYLHASNPINEMPKQSMLCRSSGC